MGLSAVGSAFPNAWHSVLGAIWSAARTETSQQWKGYLDERSTDKRYYDDVEMVPPGLWTESAEGTTADLDQISEGFVQRYRPIKFMKRLEIPEDMIDDAVYEEVFDMVAMLADTAVQTEDYYAVGILDDGTDANITWGDGVVLFSASHVVRGGGTYTNRLTPVLSPSINACNQVRIGVTKQTGSNGFQAGGKVRDWWCAADVNMRLREVLKSTEQPDTGNRAINALRGMVGDTINEVPLLSSTTQWGARTKSRRGSFLVWRRKPRFRKDKDIKAEVECHVGSFRCVVGVSDPRIYYTGSAT